MVKGGRPGPGGHDDAGSGGRGQDDDECWSAEYDQAAAAGGPGPVRDHVRGGAWHGAAAHHGRSADDPGAEVNAAATTARDDEHDAAAGGDGREQPGESYSTEIVKPFQVFRAKKL